MEIEKLGFSDVTLMVGERIDSGLNLQNGVGQVSDGDPDVILLTDKRVIHLQARGRRRSAAFVSLRDVESVEITSEREGFGAFIWGGLAFVVAALLWLVWDNPVGSFLAAAAVALMGAYLVIDHLLSPSRMQATIRAGSSVLQCGVNVSQTPTDIYAFVNRLFQLKSDGAPDNPRRTRTFAPR